MSVATRWLIAAVVFVAIEILPPATHFAFLALSVGALAASIVAAFFTPVWLPWAVFVVVSAALLPVMIPLARFLFMPKARGAQSEAAPGARALVLEPIRPSGPGIVKLGLEEWRANSESESFEKDEWVEVLRVEGTSLIVRKPTIS
jgi:membrane protein implicated in regulation of membrane protease activity